MDVVSSVSAVAGLVFNVATIIKTCKDIRGRYRDADKTIESIRLELEILQGALNELLNLMMHDPSALTSQWDTSKRLSLAFERVLTGFRRTTTSLEEVVEPLRTNEPLGKKGKFKLLWNDDAMREHLGQLRAQSGALQLLLQVLQTGSISVINTNLANVEAALARLSASSNTNGNIWDLPAYRNEVPSPSHILDLEEDLLELEWSDVMPDDRTTPSPLVRPKIARHQCVSSTPTMSSSKATVDAEGSSVDGQEKGKAASTEVPVSSHNHFEIYATTPDSVSSPLENSTSYCDAGEQSNGPLTSPMGQDGAAPGPLNSKEYAKSSKSLQREGYNPRTSIPPLIRAVYRGDVEGVKSIIADGTDLDVRLPQNGRTAVIVAAQLGDSEILEKLIDSGASVTIVDGWDRTALHYAASEGWIDCVKLLFLHEAPIDCKDMGGDTPMLSAFRSFDKAEVLDFMLSRNLDPLKHIDKIGRTILHLAAAMHSDDSSTIKLILNKIRIAEHQQDCSIVDGDEPKSSAKCDCQLYPGIEREDYVGQTALERAIRNGSNAIASTLLDYSPRSAVDSPWRRYLVSGRRSGIPDQKSWERPLHLAVRRCTLDLLQTLIAAGANLELLDGCGRTPLQFSIVQNNQDATDMLLANGASLFTKSETGWLPFHFAVRFGTMTTVRQTIAPVWVRKARITETFKKAIEIACDRGFVDVVKYILQELNVHFTELDNEALRAAVQYGRKEITEYLLQLCWFSNETLNSTQQTKFKRLKERKSRPGNSLEDYEACKLLLEGGKGPG